MLVDTELIRLVSGGDREAAGHLVESVWTDAYRIARTVAADQQTAEDAAQEACIEMLTSLPRLRNPEAFRAWFFRLVVRSAYRELKRGSREVPVADPPDKSSSEWRYDHLREAFVSLPRKDHLALVLHYDYGFTSDEIANVLGVVAGTVRYRLWNARRRLKQLLLEEDQERGDSHGTL